MDANAPATPPRPGQALFRGFRHYLVWWCIWMTLGSVAMPVPEVPDDQFWNAKLMQLAWGMVVGAASAIVFTLGQNLINAKRSKPLAWALAIGIWVGVNLAWVVI